MTYLNLDLRCHDLITYISWFSIAIFTCQTSAELVDRIYPEKDQSYIYGSAMVNNNDRISLIYGEQAGRMYESESTKFVLENRYVSKPSEVAWDQSLLTLPDIQLEPHIPLWQLAMDNNSLYILANSTTRGRSRILIDMDLDGNVIRSKWLDRFMFQRSIKLTQHGLIVTFQSQIVFLDKAELDTLAIWEHPSPIQWNAIRGKASNIMAACAEDQDVFIMEYSGLPGEDIFSSDTVGNIGITQLSLSPSGFSDEAPLATLSTSLTRTRNQLGPATGESIVVAGGRLAATVINELGRWSICEIPRTPIPTPVCTELEQASTSNPWGTVLAIEGFSGGYVWGLPSQGEVIIGIHAVETMIQKISLEEGIATAVRFAANEESVFALVDVSVHAEAGKRHHLELHKIVLPASSDR